MENRHGLLVDACLTPADGHAERVAALAMIEPRADRPRAITLGADKAYDAEDFVNELRSMTVTPHVAQNTSGRSSAIDARTTRHGGYAISQRVRKRIEEALDGSASIFRTCPAHLANRRLAHGTLVDGFIAMVRAANGLSRHRLRLPPL